jgi:hypothetical protein
MKACCTCRAWKRLRKVPGYGTCRRHAPQALPEAAIQPARLMTANWQETWLGDYCCEHLPKTTKKRSKP